MAKQGENPVTSEYPARSGKPVTVNTGTPNYDRGQRVSVVVITETLEGQESNLSVFGTKKQRQTFVRNVFGLMALMLLLDVVIVVVAINVDEVNKVLRENLLLYIFSYLVFLAVYITLICCGTLRRKTPCNFIMLAVLSISMGFMLAMISTHHGTEAVLFAATGALIVSVSMVLFAAICPCDVTGWGLYLFVASVILLIGGAVIIIACAGLQLCGESTRYLELGLSLTGVLVFSLYLVYDTQLVLGGRRVELDASDYVNGAIHLWIDIINLFVCLLIVGNATRS